MIKKIGPFTLLEAVAERTRLLEQVPVLALVPVKVLTNMSNMTDREWFDLVQALPVLQKHEFAGETVRCSFVDGQASFDWPKGMGLQHKIELQQNVRYHVWLEMKLELGTSLDHARHAYVSACGVEQDEQGWWLLPDFRFL